MDVQETLRDVLESVFGPEARQLHDDDGPGTFEAWDSVSHLNLILAIEAAFGIQFPADQIPDLVSVGVIRSQVEQLT